MNRIFAFAAFALVAMPASALRGPLPKLNLAQEAALRCSAVFGLIAYDQQRAAPGAGDYPPLVVRGREFFVRTTARLMDETGASREAVQALLKQRVDELQMGSMKSKDPKGFVGRMVTSCRPLLDAEVPPAAKP